MNIFKTLGFDNTNHDMDILDLEAKMAQITIENQALLSEPIINNSVATWEVFNYASVIMNGYRRNPYLRSAIKFISTSIASIDLDLTYGKREVESHQILDCMAHPNQYQTKAKLLTGIVRDILLCGNAYVYVIRGAAGIKPIFMLLRPDRILNVDVVDTWGMPVNYRYDANLDGHYIVIPAADMIHLQEEDPLISWKGTSILSALWESICLNNDTRELNKLWIDNGGQFPGVFSLKEPASKNIIDNLKTSIMSKMTGKKNFGQLPVIPAQLEFTQLAQQMTDMFYEGMSNMTAREIGITLGVPPQVMGIPEANTYSNYEQALDFYAKYTVIPLITYIIEEFNSKFQQIYGSAYTLTPDLDSVLELSAERAANEQIKRDSTIALYTNGVISHQESRAILGYEPPVAGDTFITPSKNTGNNNQTGS